MQQIVITGASGFLGRNLLKYFRDSGIDCLGVSRSRVPGLHRVENYADTPVGDCLIHCAETSDRSLANTRGNALETEARCTLSALHSKGFRHVVYTSSAVLYGDRGDTPRQINDPVVVNDAYTRIKHASEISVLNHGGTVVRLANLYGPGMATNNVISHILKQLGNDGNITMQTLDPIRDFLWINDAVNALSIVCKKRPKGVFNVGSGQGISIRQLVSLAKNIAMSDQSVVGLFNLDHPSHLVLDISSTSQLLNWKPRKELKAGIEDLINMTTKLQTNDL